MQNILKQKQTWYFQRKPPSENKRYKNLKLTKTRSSPRMKEGRQQECSPGISWDVRPGCWLNSPGIIWDVRPGCWLSSPGISWDKLGYSPRDELGCSPGLLRPIRDAKILIRFRSDWIFNLDRLNSVWTPIWASNLNLWTPISTFIMNLWTPVWTRFELDLNFWTPIWTFIMNFWTPFWTRLNFGFELQMGVHRIWTFEPRFELAMNSMNPDLNSLNSLGSANPVK